jgi:hypothetical protein
MTGTNSNERTNLQEQADAVMSAIEKGHLEGRSLQEALARYQKLWDQISAIDAMSRVNEPSSAAEIRYDAAVLADFLRHLPEGLRSDLSSGREFVHQALRSIRIKPAGHRPRQCPICQQRLGKPTPQHMATHGQTLQDAYRAYPGLGFSQGARLLVEPSPEGLLNTGEVFGFVVAGAGFGPATFGL